MRTLTLTVDANLRFAEAAVPPAMIAELARRLTIPNPEDPRRPLARGVQVADGGVCVPRGALRIVTEVAGGFGFKLEQHKSFPVASATGDHWPVCPSLRPYQAAAVDAIHERVQGAVVIPCGGGKTHVGVATIARLRRRSLVLVHTRDLTTQWCERLAAAGANPGVVAQGEDRSADITVALIQTLLQWDEARRDAFLSRFGLLILDEAHHVAAPTFSDIVGRCPARFRVGLTATPIRPDGLSDLLAWTFGPVIHTTTTQELSAAGLRVAVSLSRLITDFKADLPEQDSERAWIEVQAKLATDAPRLEAVAAEVARRAQAGHSVLCLGHRVAICHAIADRVTGFGVQARALVGDVPGRMRSQILTHARSGQLPVIVGTSLADEGLDVPVLSCLVLAWPTSATGVGRMEQRVGRIARPHDGKPPCVVVDVDDVQCGMLHAMWRKRQPVLRRILHLDTRSPQGYPDRRAS